MEKKAKKQKLCLEDVSEKEEDIFNINSLPMELLIKIFSNLGYADLCRSGRVCKKWHEATKCPVFWKKVDIQFSLDKGSMYETAMKFVEVLPACVTHLRLDFDYATDWVLDIVELTKKLRANCPELQVLVLHCARLPRRIISVFHLGEEHLANVRVLVFHNCLSDNFSELFSDKPKITSKIEVLDISRSNGLFVQRNCSQYLSKLKKLRFAGTFFWDNDIWLNDSSILSRLEVIDLEGSFCTFKVFDRIRDYCYRLVELYICFTKVKEKSLIFDNSIKAFPCLKIICLRGCRVTYKCVASLIKSCPSLQHVYIGDIESSNDFTECTSKKVKIIHGMDYCYHHARVDYMLE